jgi:hypothetical protein
VKVLVAGRMMLETDEAGEESWRFWAMAAGVVAKYVGLGAGEPRSETVRQKTADGVATAYQDECLVGILIRSFLHAAGLGAYKILSGISFLFIH